MTTYPNLDANDIWALVEIVKNNELDQAPYPEEFKALFQRNTTIEKLKTESIEDLEGEISAIFGQMEDFEDQMTDTTKDEVRIAYIKLRAQLVGKLLELKERALNMKTVRAFQDKVIRAMDEILSTEQRTQFMEMLEK